MNNKLTQDTLKRLLDYDENTGLFYAKTTIANRAVGSIAGTKHSNGYTVIAVAGTRYFAHRLAWLYVNGSWPIGTLDHINIDKSDNRISNLRVLSNEENIQNRSSPSKHNTTGYLGVIKNGSRWGAKITVSKKRIYIGSFDTPHEAHCAYLGAKSVLHQFAPKGLKCDLSSRYFYKIQ